MAKKEVAKNEKKVVAKKETKAAPAKAEPKKAAASVKEVKAAPKKEEAGAKAYHVSKREKDNKWQVKLAKGEAVIKLFDTKAEALEYVNAMAERQGATVRFHASKGANKGKIRKI